MKKIFSLILSVCLIAGLMPNIVTAAPTEPASHFTPQRGIQEIAQKGTPGYTYTSYNNFGYDLKIWDYDSQSYLDGITQHIDERKFTYATILNNYSEITSSNFANYWYEDPAQGKVFKNDQLVVFRVFFHNNGEDPYDGVNPVLGPSDARDTYVGVDIASPYNPKGFIYSVDNEYKVKGPSGGYSSIKYQSGDYMYESAKVGDVARTASDDVTFAFDPQNTIQLDYDIKNLIPNMQVLGAIVSMEYDTDGDGTIENSEKFADYDWVTKGSPLSVNIPVPNTNVNGTGSKSGTKTLNLTFDQVGTREWIKINKHPACFRYAGRAYFLAKIKRTPTTPNFCTSLSLTKSSTGTCSPDNKIFAFNIDVKFNQTPTPTGGYVKLYSTDLKGKVYIDPDANTEIQLPYTTPIVNGHVSGYYKGLGELKAIFTDKDGNTAVYVDENGNKIPVEEIQAYSKSAPSSCEAPLTACTDDCVNICVERPTDIPAGSLSQFSAEATGYYGDTWDGDIQYFAEKGKGKFYKGKKSDVIAQIKEDFPGANPYDNPNLTLGCDNLINIVITPNNILNLIKNTFTPTETVDLTKTGTQTEETQDNTSKLPQYNFIKTTTQEQFYELPENYQMQEIPTGGDPNPANTGTKKFMNSVLMALDLKTYQPKTQDINLKTNLDISTSTGSQNLKTIDQGDINNSLDLNDLNIDTSTGYTQPDIVDVPKGTFTLPSNNDEPLNPFADYESAVTAKENEQVWFYAAEEGDDSIVVQATKTLNPDCSQKFSISAAPVCNSMTVSAYDTKSAVNKGNLKCINEGQAVKFTIDNITMSNGQKLDLSKDKVSTIWTTTDTVGKFSNGAKTFQSTSNEITYTGKGQVSCEVTAINGLTEENSLCSYSIAACPKVIEKCGTLDLKFDKIVKPIASNKITTVDQTKTVEGATVTMTVTSDKSADYPSYIIWEDTTGGELVFKNSQYVQKLPDSFMTKVVNGVETTVTIKNYSAKYPEAGMPTLKNSKKAGTLKASVQGEESVCSAVLNIIEVQKVTNVCQLLTTQVQTMGTSTWITNPTLPLSTANNYYIKNALTYSPDLDESLKLVDYTTTKGYFAKAIKLGEAPIAGELPGWMVTALNGVLLPAYDIGWVQELKGVPAETSVIFIPDKSLAAGTTWPAAITITASGSTEPGCTKTISLKVPESKEDCKSITLNADPSWWPLSTQNFSSEKGTKFWLTGNTGDYTGNFTFKLIPEFPYYNYISLNSKIDLNIQKLTKELEITKKDAFESGIYAFGLDPYMSWTIVATASEKGQEACIASLKYSPPPPPAKEIECEKLTITKPSSWTLDSGKEELFEVKVEPSGYAWKVKWSTTSGTFDVAATYGDNPKNTLKTFSGGTSITVKVEEDGSLKDKDSNCIQPMTVKTPEQHEDTEASMKKKVIKANLEDAIDASSSDWENIINISGKPIPTKDKYITYKIDFEQGTGSNKAKSVLIQDKKLDNGELTSKQGGKLTLESWDNIEIELHGDEDDLEICEYDEDGLKDNDPCVTTPGQADKNDDDLGINEDDLFNSFKNGNEGLVFNNIENVDKIKIFYQMKNNTSLTQDKCADLDPEVDGCGEKFENEAYFKTYSKDDLENKIEDGDASTTVIAVCPYILTRASGDVFFETALKTGTDVAYCSKQKNVPAPIITPIEEQQENVSTGGTRAQPTLTLPSHSICKYSNVEGSGNPEDYQNPFANFSSTICEMKAEVAEDWMKENVVDQINTNAEKVSLWSQPQTIGTLETALQLSSPTSGIFRWDNDLTIKGASYSRTSGKFSKYTIEKNSAASIPAAQTYIIMNADLYINSDIIYGSTTTPTDLKSYPSAAFIVINGNIHIAADVERLDGTYIAIDATPDDRSVTGKVFATNDEDSYSQLTINGSLIGDVIDLFTHRKYVGNVASDEGSVTIKYNENLLLNPPPGLNKLMDVRQLEVAY